MGVRRVGHVARVQENENYTQGFYVKILRKRDHLEDLDEDVSIILK
jgi:hypothetical protein